MGRLGPAPQPPAASALSLIDAREGEATSWLRAAAHITTGADEDSELLLAWLGQPAAWPIDSVADNPAAAHKLLKLIAINWATLSKEPRTRERG